MKKYAFSLLLVSSFVASLECANHKARRRSSHSSEGEDITKAIDQANVGALKDIQKRGGKADIGSYLQYAITRFIAGDKKSTAVLEFVAGQATEAARTTALRDAQKKAGVPAKEARKKAALAGVLARVN